MSELAKVKLTKRVVDAAQAAVERYVIWDSTLPGFGLRVAPTGRKVFILRYRPKGAVASKRFMTIGLYGPITPDQARDRALKILGDVAAGLDPAKVANSRSTLLTVQELAGQFMDQHVLAKRKAATVSAYRHSFSKVDAAGLGTRSAAELTKGDVAKLHASLSSTPFVANYAIASLSSMYTWANKQGLVPEGFNPARGVVKFREMRRERFLTSDELRRLGDTLRLAETTGLPYAVDEGAEKAKHAPKPENRTTLVSPYAVGAIRLLLFTGCRLREILHLRWAEVDIERAALFLPDSKTGRRTIILGTPALRVLETLPRLGPFVIPGDDPMKPRSDLKRPWTAIRKHAGLEGLRIHDLRHSFASVGAGSGLGLPVIGRLLGHAQASTTARYAHLADDPLRRASEAISQKIAGEMGDHH
ncbi:MAG: integrase [Hyphomicrobiales bacterium]|nr:integrase [Hyphomicrobiales bacterium]